MNSEVHFGRAWVSSCVDDYETGYSEAASVLESGNTRLCLSDYRTHICSDKRHAFGGAIWTVIVVGHNSSRADERAIESSATVLFLGEGGG